MKHVLTVIMLLTAAGSFAQEYRVITTVESLATSRFGQSGMVDHQLPADYKLLTTEREGKEQQKRKKSDRVKIKDFKIEKFSETRLMNFYDGFNVDFQNIASNDAVFSSKLTAMAKEGWQLLFVTSGVEGDGGKDDNHGLFITRYIFKK
jgi:hypothetical protein